MFCFSSLSKKYPKTEYLQYPITGKGKLVQVWANAGHGKTWFCLEWACAIANGQDFLKWKSWTLSHSNGIQLLIPPNYANGYLCLSDCCLLHYKLFYKGSYFDHKKQFSIKWNDPLINTNWPIKKPILSKRDKETKFIKI